MIKKTILWAPLKSINFSKNIADILDTNDEIDNETLRDHQQLVSNYLNINSPYRGLLLYHGLGSGKTRTSINMAEKFKIERKTIVFLPGPALEENFIQELEKFNVSYSPKDKYWIIKYDNNNKSYWDVDKTQKISNYSSLTKKNQKEIRIQIRKKIDENYTIIKYNGISINKLEKCIEDRILDNKFVIIDESHNIISMITNYLSEESNTKQNMKGRLFWKLFMNSTNTKFLFLSGTPILNYPKELSAIFNILQGTKILYNYRITTTLNAEDLLNNMRKYPYAEYINFRNDILEIIPSPKNFRVENDLLKKDLNYPLNHLEWLKHLKKYVKSLNNSNLKPNDKETTILNCFPLDDNFDKAFISKNDLINKDVFLRRIVGYVSYYDDSISQTTNSEFFPKITEYEDKFDMTETQYIRYEKARIKEINQDAKKAQRKMKIFEDDKVDVTTYRSRSLAICNFAYPLKIDIDEFAISQKGKQDLYNKYINEFEIFLRNKSDKNLNKIFNELSPKYTKIINRIENSEGSNTIYSRLKNREGLTALFSMLKRKGWTEFNISFANNEWQCQHGNEKTYCIYSDNIYKEYIKHIFNNELSEIPIGLRNKLPFQTNLNGEIINSLFITASASEGITLKNVRNLHIIESHWSNIRLKQVIGRVNRFNSHIDLPLEKRTVNVYKYVTIFGDNLKNNYKSSNNNLQNILNTDNNLTSDECVINVANRKELINNKLLSCLKISSIDCFKNMKSQCYQINNNSYHPNFEKHLLNSRINIPKKIQLKQIKLSKKKWIPKKYHLQNVLYDENKNLIYDKESVRKGFPMKIAIYIEKIKYFKEFI